MSLDAHGELGYSNGYGAIRFGFNRFGLRTDYAGIYQRRPRKRGSLTARLKFYRPTNPQTVPQQAWRSVFADGWVAWGALTPTERMPYYRRAKRLRMSGPNAFMREWLSQHLL